MGKRKPIRGAPAAPLPSSPLPASPHADAAAIVALLLLHLVFWWRAAALRGFLLISDICYFFEPARSYLHEALRAGRLALWSPYVFCGYPLGAEGQVATFYPPSLLFSWFLDGGGAVNWLVISHLMLAAISTYLLARLLGSSPFAAWLSGVVFSCSGYLFAHLHHLSLLCAAAWLPLVVLCLERAWRGPLLPNAAFASLAWGAAALTGHPQTLFHITLVVLFWMAWLVAKSRRSGKGWQLRRAVGILALALALGAGLAAVQLLLTRDLASAAPHGDRGSLAYVTSFSLLIKHLFGLLAPNSQGSPAFQDYHGERYYWEYVLYLGLLPLALAAIGGATRRGWTLAGLAASALVLALAEGNPLYHLLRHLPGFADFRAPARWIFVFTFACALLAAIGWDSLTPLMRTQSRRLVAALVAIIAVAAVPAILITRCEPVTPVTVAGTLGTLVGLGLVLRGWLRSERLAIAIAAVAAFLVVADLWHFDRTLSSLTSPAAYRYPNPVAEVLQRDRGWWRALFAPELAADAEWIPPGGWAVNPDGWVQMRLSLGASIPQSYRLRTISGYAGFVDPDQSRFFQSAYVRMMTQGDLRLFSLVGTRYVALPAGTRLPDLDRLDIGTFTVCRNPDSFPRVFAVTAISRVSSGPDALTAVLALADADRLRQAAVVTGNLRGSAPARAGKVQIDKITEARPEHVIVEATSDGDALLVLNERWDPGWQAVCDDHAVPLVEVDTVLMGAPLPKGEHTLEFRYRPRGLTLGLPISLASLAACLALVLVPPLLARKRGV